MFFTPRALAIISDRRVCRLPTIIRCQNPRFEFELMILSRAFPLLIVFHSSSLRRVMRRSSITNTSLFGHVDHRRYAMELEVSNYARSHSLEMILLLSLIIDAALKVLWYLG